MSIITRTYSFTDGTTAYGSQVDSEIANIVNTLNNLDSAATTWTNVKVTTLSPQADVNAGGHKVTNLGTPTTAGDAIAYPVTASVITAGTITNTQLAAGAALANLGAPLLVWQVVQAHTTTQTNSTSSSFAATSLSATITPSSTAHKIKITVTGGVVNTNPSATTATITLVRGSQNLADSISDGFYKLSGGSASTTSGQCAIVYYDTPITVSATTYSIHLKNSDNATQVSFTANSITSVMLLEEIG